jgi:hypothetical protein
LGAVVDEVVHEHAAQSHDARQGGEGAVAHFDGPEDLQLIFLKGGEGGSGFGGGGVEFLEQFRI